MSNLRLVLVLVLVLVLDQGAIAAPDRTSYVSRALAAVRSLGPARDTLDKQIYDDIRLKCHTDAPTCAIEVARAACKGDPSCTAAADVIVTNQRSVSDFVDDAKRMRLVQGATDYHAALAAELRKRYAILGAELVLARHDTGADDGAAIDKLCRERDRAIHACEDGAPACIPSLPWNRCVAALVWFVGGGKP